MTQASALLLGSHDFTSMAASDPDRAQRDEDDDSPSPHPTQNPIKPNPVKTITLAEWSRRPSPAQQDLLIFRIAGSGFLHHMVRNIVGTLVEIGRGALEPSDLTRILDARDRTAAGPTAPAHGLYLVEVVYNSDSVTTETQGRLQDDVRNDVVAVGERGVAS
jgi:tRNA pseudouridine38-40 synthase